MVSALPTARTTSRVFSGLAILSASMTSLYLLLPLPLADVFFAGIVLLSVIFALLGGIGAWTNRPSLVWVAALLLTGLSIMGMMSIGFVLAPAALFLLGAALFAQLAGPRTGVQEAIRANPPTVPEAVVKTLAGTVSVAVGAGLVYVGAFSQELFTACASETLTCSLANTHWDAVGLTLLGLLAVCLGGWLIWKQVYISRTLSSTQTG